MGSITSGGTESLLLMVKTYRDYARFHRPEIKEPEMIVCSTGHPGIHKASEYFGVKITLIDYDEEFRLNPSRVKKAINKNTILIVASAP